MRTTFYCRIQILLAKEGLLCPASDIFGRRGRRWLQAQELSPIHRELVDLLARQADALKEEITVLEDHLREALEDQPALARLLTVPGFGFLTAATFLAEVGDVSRFPRARNLVSYLGLAPRVHASGGRVRMGRLTKEGLPWCVPISCRPLTMPSAGQASIRISISVSILDPVPKLHE